MDVMLDEWEANPLAQRMLDEAAKPIRPGTGIPLAQVAKTLRDLRRKKSRGKKPRG